MRIFMLANVWASSSCLAFRVFVKGDARSSLCVVCLDKALEYFEIYYVLHECSFVKVYLETYV